MSQKSHIFIDDDAAILERGDALLPASSASSLSDKEEDAVTNQESIREICS